MKSLLTLSIAITALAFSSTSTRAELTPPSLSEQSVASTEQSAPAPGSFVYLKSSDAPIAAFAYIASVPADRWTQSIFAIALAFAACAYLPKCYRSLGAFKRYIVEVMRDPLERVSLQVKRALFVLRVIAAQFCNGLRSDFCTANRADLRTANAAEVRAVLAGARLPDYDPNAQLRHGLLTTANASLFDSTHLSEAMTGYAVGWTDPHGYDAASEFIAPSLMPGGELYEHFEYPNAEAFLSDEAPDDLRPIGADFKTVDYTQSKTQREIPNRGLRMVVDYDRVRRMPNWQQLYTGRLMQRLKRNAFRRKYALALAAGAAAALTWDAAGGADPDLDIAKQTKAAGDSSGISPNRALWGQAAKLLRFATYGATNTAKAMAGRMLSPEEASAKAGLQALVDESRVQNGASKAQIVGSKIILFSAYGMSGEDPSNFKTAIGTTQQGGRYAVYVRQIGVKFWEITVETYETEFCATTLGVRTLTISDV
jgi:hypothetical protein